MAATAAGCFTGKTGAFLAPMGLKASSSPPHRHIAPAAPHLPHANASIGTLKPSWRSQLLPALAIGVAGAAHGYACSRKVKKGLNSGLQKFKGNVTSLQAAVAGSAAQRVTAAAGIKIAGTGSCAPEATVTNDHLAEVIDTNDEWITQRTGIRRRHVLQPGEDLGQICTKAAQKALDSAGLAAEEVELVILATSSPDDIFGTATTVAVELGATNAVAFDLTAACSGFVFAMVTAAQYFRSGTVSSAVVIGADCLSRWVDWTDRSTCVLFGDGAGAVVLKATDADDDCLLGFELGSDGNGRCHLGVTANPGPEVSVGGGYHATPGAFKPLHMNGAEVYRFAIRRVPKVLKSMLMRHEIDGDDIDWLLLHQANRRIMDSAAKRFKIPKEKIICNLEEYGNTSAASIPLALDEAVRDGRVKPGNLVACVGFGAGLSWGGMLFRA